jgi:ubiquinone/menaquinone biosynthesis C-methylase UbiE
VDITQEAVQLTRAHAEMSGVAAAVTVLQSDAEKLDGLADQSFDYLYSWGVMHHSSAPESCFRQSARVLKPGGKGLIMVYHKSSLRYWLKGTIWLLLKGKLFSGSNYDSVQRFYTDGYYHKHYTRQGFAAALVEAGLKVTAVDVTHMSSRMVPWVPDGLRNWLKARVGWLLVAHIDKP